MKFYLFFGIIFLGQFLSAQPFIEKTGTPFVGTHWGSLAFADVDNDNGEDVLITGRNETGIYFSKLYTNDGLGNFSEKIGTPFEAVFASSIAFSDVDGDNDMDVLITGQNASENHIAKLYINNGQGDFTDKMASIGGVEQSSIAFADIDGDNDQDLVITGLAEVGIRVTHLYTNDGQGNFSYVSASLLEEVRLGDIAFADVDGDNDQDLLITGDKGGTIDKISKLYINDGDGNFSEKIDAALEGVTQSSIAFSDIDGDNDQDLLITGLVEVPGIGTSKLYLNDGSSNFSERISLIEDIQNGSIAFSDIDGDNDQDLLITGGIGLNTRITRLYTNDGLGYFNEMVGTTFAGVSSSSVAFSDVDSDGDQDILITGLDNSNTSISKLYINERIISSSSAATQETPFDFMLYPNPSRLTLMNVSYSSTRSGILTVRIYNIKGQLILKRQELISSGEQIFSIDITSLEKGSYTIQVGDGENNGTRKFLVQ